MHGRAKDLTNFSFGKLTATSPTNERISGSLVWLCICECGNEIKVPCSYLIHGDKKCCGCSIERKCLDLKGKKIGRLLVIDINAEIGVRNRQVLWDCICDCGNKVTVYGTRLNTGRVKSCGCLQKDIHTKRITTHGMSDTPEYDIWCAMKGRCENENYDSYSDYGGRGIGVYPPWSQSFESFYSYVGKRPSPEMSLDRYPDNNGNYEPGNVRWGTGDQQSRNKRNNYWIEFEGKKMVLQDWANMLKIRSGTLFKFLKKHSIREAINRYGRFID